MKIFVTGATGYVGSVVAEKLATASHQVVALARSDESAAALRTRGYATVRGDAADANAVARHAAESDAVIHVANTQTAANAAVDAGLARAIIAALAGSGKRFIYTSGAWSFSSTHEQGVDESSPTDPLNLTAWRVPVECEVAASGGVVLRPGIVFGRGERLQGIPGMLVREAIDFGRTRFVGDGYQEWPLVHVDDLADLYVRALAAPAGSILHGVGPARATMRDVAVAASFAGGAGGRVESWPIEDAREALGGFADALHASQRILAARTRALTHWSPSGATLVEELLSGSYARGVAAAAEKVTVQPVASR